MVEEDAEARRSRIDGTDEAAGVDREVLGAGYDYDLPRFAAERRRYSAHMRPRGEERATADSTDSLKKRRRWLRMRLRVHVGGGYRRGK
jgi:hypothetical protein